MGAIHSVFPFGDFCWVLYMAWLLWKMMTTTCKSDHHAQPQKLIWGNGQREAERGGQSLVKDKKAKGKSIWGNGRGERYRGKPGQPPMTILLPPLLQSHTQEKIAPLTSSRQYLQSCLTESLQTIVFCALDLFYASTRIWWLVEIFRQVHSTRGKIEGGGE